MQTVQFCSQAKDRILNLLAIQVCLVHAGKAEERQLGAWVSPQHSLKIFFFPLLLVCLWISVTQTDIFLSLLMTHVLMTGCLQTMLKTHRQVSRAFAFPASLKHPLKLKMGKWKHTH